MKKFIAVAGNAVLVAGTAFAGDRENTFIELDQNRDGVLTRVEASPDEEFLARLDSADTNQDGKLISSEFDSIKDEPKEAE